MHKIQYLRVVLTNRCNLRCFFCHKEGSQQDISYDIDYESVKNYIKILVNCGIRKIKFMGGEPTLYPHLIDLIEFVYSIDNTLDISVISNGIMNVKILNALVKSHANRINISLHGYFEKEFKTITGGNQQNLKTILNTINVLSKNNKLGKINYVLLKNINLNEFRGVLEYICKHNYTLDVLNYLGDDTIKVKKFHLEFDDIYKIIAKYYNVVREENFINNYSITSKRLYLKNGGVINLKVNKLSDYFFLKSCSTCLKRNLCKEGIAAIRLTTEGKIQPCLFRYDNILDMKKVIDNNELSDSKAIVYNYFENL